MKFQVEYPNGKTEVVEQSDCETIEQFINTKFGRGAKPEAKVTTLEDAPAEAEEAKPAKTSKAKK